ncbi:MAG: hypothetical protein EOO22_06585 [Comamonadaceae bacterium]|nr:MAG: hypothetical protein EOO22_06585 [Comamonadaceae bacterium]
MGIALLSFADLFTPLQSLANRWMPARRAHHNGGLRYVAVRPACTGRPVAVTASPAVRPLRVVRVLEGHRTGRASGRVVLSGRMADVCAELDRLAALEAAGEARSAVH